MIQGGDIENGDGTGTVSIYGREFGDENLNWREMDTAGLVCSANRGKDTNGSQYEQITSLRTRRIAANSGHVQVLHYSGAYSSFERKAYHLWTVGFRKGRSRKNRRC